jgi:DNA adenine methylase
MKSPFPYFGGKSKIASDVWARFGDVKNYVEPFFGSGAILLSRPDVDLDNLPLETVNDKDGLLANFWRALQADAERVAHYADWPVNENDFHARHIWLVNNRDDITKKLLLPNFAAR